MTSLIMPTYSFPRDMPLRWDGFPPFETATFQPLYAQAAAPTRGSMIQVVNLAPDLWTMQFQSHVLALDEAMQYQAWLQSLRGGARLFKAWHPLCEFPQAYQDGWEDLLVGASPFTGAGTLADIGVQRDTLDISELPVDFALTAGDMLSIPLGATSRTLHRVMVDAVADGAGDVTVYVEPTIPLSLSVDSPADQEVLFEKPYCLAVVDAASIQGPWQSPMLARVSFNATQTF